MFYTKCAFLQVSCLDDILIMWVFFIRDLAWRISKADEVLGRV
jgi:hypothetical protein